MNTILVEFATIVMPAILQVFGVVLSVLLMRAAVVAKSRWGVQVEANDREALHSALMTGVRVALQRGLGTQAAIGVAIAHATTSVPDALTRLKPPQAVLEKLAEAADQKVRAELPGLRAAGVVEVTS